MQSKRISQLLDFFVSKLILKIESGPNYHTFTSINTFLKNSLAEYLMFIRTFFEMD